MLHRATGADLDALKSRIWAGTLSKTIVPSQFNAALGTIDFGTSPSSSSVTGVDKLVVLMPQSLLLNEAVTTESVVVEVGLPTSSSLSWPALRDLTLSCQRLYTIIESLIYRLPLLCWPYDYHRKRASAFKAQSIIGSIPPSTDFGKLCDEANLIKLTPDASRTWLQSLDERRMRENLGELAERILRPRPTISFKLRDYPSLNAFPSIKDAQAKLTSALTWLKAADDSDAASRQRVFDATSESYRVLSSVLNAIIVSMSLGRLDSIYWRSNGENLLREIELATDYERVSMAREAYEALSKELTYLKEFRRRHQRFTMLRLLPVELSMLYEDEFKRVFGHFSAGKSNSRSSANAPSAGGSSLAHSSSTSDAMSSSHLGSSASTQSIDNLLAASTERRHLDHRISELEASQLQYRRHLETLSRDNDLLKSRNEMLTSQVATPSMPAQVQEVESKYKNLEDEYTSLQKSYHQVVSQKDQYSHSIEDQVATIEEVRREREKAVNNLTETRGEIDSLKQLLEDLQAENTTLHTELRLAQKERDAQRASLVELQRKFESDRLGTRTLETSMAETQATLEAEVHLARTKYESALTEQRSAEDRAISLEQKVRLIESERDDFERKAALLVADLAEKQALFTLERSTSTESQTALRQQMEEAKREIATLTTSTLQQTATITSLTEAKASLSQTITEQNMELTNRLVSIQKMQTDLDSQIAKMINMEDEMALLERERDQSRKDAKFARQLHDEASPGVDPALPELENMTKAELITDVLRQRKELEEARKIFTSDLDLAQSHIATIAQRLDRANRINEELLRQQSLRQSAD